MSQSNPSDARSEEFSSRSSEPIVEPPDFVSDNNNLRILYITLAIIVVFLIVWIVIILFVQDDPLTILIEMNNLTTNLNPVSDV